MKEILMHFDSFGNHLCQKHAMEKAMEGESVTMQLQTREDDYEVDCCECNYEEEPCTDVSKYIIAELREQLSDAKVRISFLMNKVEGLEITLAQRDRLLKMEYDRYMELSEQVPKPKLKKKKSFLDMTTPEEPASGEESLDEEPQ